MAGELSSTSQVERVEQIFAGNDGLDESRRGQRKRIPLAPDAERDLSAATLLFLNGEYAAAVALLQSVIRREPKSAEAFKRLGQVKLMMNDPEDALEALFFAASLRSTDADLWRDVGELAERVNPPQLSRARDAYTNITRICRNGQPVTVLVPALWSRAKVKSKMAKFGEAAADYKRLLTIQPDNTRARYQCVMCLMKDGKYAEAHETVADTLREAVARCHNEASQLNARRTTASAALGEVVADNAATATPAAAAALRRSVTPALKMATQFTQMKAYCMLRVRKHASALSALRDLLDLYREYGVEGDFPMDHAVMREAAAVVCFKGPCVVRASGTSSDDDDAPAAAANGHGDGDLPAAALGAGDADTVSGGAAVTTTTTPTTPTNTTTAGGDKDVVGSYRLATPAEAIAQWTRVLDPVLARTAGVATQDVEGVMLLVEAVARYCSPLEYTKPLAVYALERCGSSTSFSVQSVHRALAVGSVDYAVRHAHDKVAAVTSLLTAYASTVAIAKLQGLLVLRAVTGGAVRGCVRTLCVFACVRARLVGLRVEY
jgi:tetratricopeptide (TPR) repeat protein